MMQEQLSGSRERVDEDDSYDQWTYIADALDEYYKDRQGVICAELDGLLSFSGIFSAVVTLFVGQALDWLQPDNVRLSANILSRISQQISNQTNQTTTHSQHISNQTNQIMAHSQHISNQTNQTMTSSDSKHETHIVRELSVWFMLSLFISLGVSIACLWAKTCISKYLLDHPSSPYDRALSHLYRNYVLQKWLLHHITTFLVTLLLISFASFSYGMATLAEKLEYHYISTVIVVITTLNLIGAFGSILVPFVVPSWPLKPLIPPFRVALPPRRSDSGSPSLTTKLGTTFSMLSGLKFSTLEKRKLDEIRRHQGALELEALAFANRKFWGTRRLYAINELFKQVDDRGAALDCIMRILRVDGAAYLGALGLSTVHPPTRVFPRDTQADKGLSEHLRKVGRQILEELEDSQSGSTSGYGQQGGSLSEYRRVFASASNGSG